MVGEPFDEAQVFEEAAPGRQTALRCERGVGACDRDFARQRVQGNVVVAFTRQVKRNQ